MESKITYQFSAKIWKHGETGGWHFVSLPKDISKEIRMYNSQLEEGWGRMKATATINSFLWETAIWFDTKQDTYLLPLKAEVRKKEKLAINDTIIVQIKI
ncbi:DUF1905 domain-containing protein [Tenacibaculum amylolyticum]|uniref:DUF1905 domain-containing protein n=1 Tax=Tenacibaculum amylolyticum TaxID=104269 RepID=UPI0038B5BDE1